MLRYRFDVLERLRDAGYSTYTIREGKLLGGSTVTRLKAEDKISWDNIDRICALLHCQPGDLLEYVEDENADSRDK